MSGGVQRPTRRYAYETDGSAIYSESFRRIRQGADLAAFTPEEAQVAVRMIHAAGDLDLPRHIRLPPRPGAAARSALRDGAPIFVDANMIKSGITRKRLPADNEVRCLLRDQQATALAEEWGNHPFRRRSITVGGTTWRVRWWRSATPQPRCSTSWS